MSGSLTTHVLDTAHGIAASGMTIEVWTLDGAAEVRRRLKTAITNADGRVDTPLLAGDEFEATVYELVFHVGAYFAARGVVSAGDAFLRTVPVRFGVANAFAHYHVPLLVSPYGYSTYRGS